MKLQILALTTLAIACSIATRAQTAPKASVYVKGGLNLSNVTIDKNGNIDNNRTLPSFHVGLQADLPIGSYFAIQPAVLFTGKGSKLESGNTSGDNWYRATTRPYYIEVPVNAVVKLPLGNGANFFIGAGPYLGIGVGGKNRVEGEVLGKSFSRSEKIKFSDDDPFTSTEEGSGYNIMRRFDYGLNGTIGVQAKAAMFSVNYGLGLAKLQSGTSNSADELNKYRIWSFTVGFRL